jgi:phospholipase/carboxylesterase
LPEPELPQLVYGERAASGTPAGLLVLHHGRGTDERDVLPFADTLDPARRLQVVTPRGPLQLAGFPGHHWYSVPRVGYPDPDTFQAAYRALSGFHDELWLSTGIAPEQTVLGGFSMGAVMSYSLALGRERPVVAGVLAFSGFIPQVSGWEPSFEGREQTRAFVAHGRNDPVIDVSFGRLARDTLAAGGLEVSYHESALAHQIAPDHARAAASWLAGTLGSEGM